MSFIIAVIMMPTANIVMTAMVAGVLFCISSLVLGLKYASQLMEPLLV